MASDLTTAIALAGAALTGALANVEINVGSMKPGFADDDAFVKGTKAQAEKLKNLRS
jgi:formiminotetrahydrofolate cyclodeaminase